MNIRSLKLWINIVTIAALGLLILLSWDQIKEAFSNLLNVNLFWLALFGPLQAAKFYATGRFYKDYLKSLNEDISTKEAVKLSLEMNFVNTVFPSGGVSGFGYFAARLRKQGISASKSTLIQVTRYSLMFLSFVAYLGIALLLLALLGTASRLMVLISSTIIFLVLIGAGLLIYLISNQKRITSFTAYLPKAVNRFIGVFRPSKKPTINIEKIEKLFTDLHGDYMHVQSNWKQLKRPFVWTMLMNLMELLTIFAIYMAFGALVNPGAIIIAYAVANVAGLVSVLPGGVGIYEGLMTAVLTSAGVPRGVALSTTLLFRVLTMVVFLPVGFVFYQIALGRKSSPASTEPPEEV